MDLYELADISHPSQRSLIPPAVLLGCRHCGWAWVQTLAYALANPNGYVRCPQCQEYWTVPTDVDEPTIVESAS